MKPGAHSTLPARAAHLFCKAALSGYNQRRGCFDGGPAGRSAGDKIRGGGGIYPKHVRAVVIRKPVVTRGQLSLALSRL